MKIDVLQVGYISTNCYILTDDVSSDAVIIDAGASFERIKEHLDASGKKAVAVLLTHGHFDHIGAAGEFQRAGAKIYAHEAEADMMYNGCALSRRFGLNRPQLVADVKLRGGEDFEIAGLTFSAIHTAGHSKGGVCYLCGENLFCGDTIFFEDYGRTDLNGGDFNELKKSVSEKIFTLPAQTILYPGHGEASTVGYEKEHNSIAVESR